MRRRATVLAWAALLAASLLLLVVSWGRWSDAIVDSGSEWILPDGLARGGLLYRDVVHWFGPLPPYLVALLFRLFGSGFRTLVLAGGLTTIATLAALHAALRRVTGRLEAALWCAIAVAALVFMPWGGGSLLGMGLRIWLAAALTLAAVTLAVRRGNAPSHAVLAGGLAGLAGLCRTEWGLAAAAAAAVALFVRIGPRRAIRSWIGIAAGWAVIFGGGILLFVGLAGSEAVIEDGHVLLSGLPEETRKFLFHASGLHDVPGGLLRMIRSSALWTSGWILLATIALRERGSGWVRARLPLLAAALAVTLLCRHYAGPWPMYLFSAAPLAGATSVWVGLSRRGPRAAAFAAFGSLAVVLSYRRPFSITDWPYVAPALLFAVVSAAGLLRLSIAVARSPQRRSLRRVAAAGLAAVFAAFVVGRVLWYRNDPRVPVPGTSALLHADAARAAWLDRAASTIRESTGPEEALVVFPEGAVLNFLAGRRNPLRHWLYIPGYLTEENEPRVLAELQRVWPGAIVVMNRTTREYGRARFGEDYGRSIAEWIAQNYEPASAIRDEGTGDLLYLRRDRDRHEPRSSPAGAI
jgi:hypothetical protein